MPVLHKSRSLVSNAADDGSILRVKEEVPVRLTAST